MQNRTHHNQARVPKFLEGVDTESQNTSDVFTVDEAVEKVGFGWFHVKLTLFAGTIWMVDAMEMMVVSFLSPAARCYFDLTGGQVAMITAIAFVGMICGSTPYGWLMDKYGRRRGLLIASAFIGLFGLASAFSPSYLFLLVMRFIVGFNIAAVPQAMTYYAEFMPSKHRAKGIACLAISFSIGTVLQALLAMGVMPHLGWRYLLGISTTPVLLSLLLYPTMPESPRYLMATGKRRQAMLVLQSLANGNKKSLPPGRLVSLQDKEKSIEMAHVKMLASNARAIRAVSPSQTSRTGSFSSASDASVAAEDGDMALRSNPFEDHSMTEHLLPGPDRRYDHHQDGGDVAESDFGDTASIAAALAHHNSFLSSLRDLFSSRDIGKSTLLLWWLWFVLAFVYFGIVLISEQLLRLPGDSSNVCEHGARNASQNASCQFKFEEYVEIMWTTTAEIPGLGVAALLMTYMGRRSSLRILLLSVTLFFSFLFICNVSKTVMLFFVFGIRASINGCYQVAFIFTGEMYPTKTRAFSVSCCTAISRLGAIVTSFIAEVVLESSLTNGKLIYTAVSFVTFLSAFAFPIETRGRPLT